MSNFLFKRGDYVYYPWTSDWVAESAAVQAQIPRLENDALNLVRWQAQHGENTGAITIKLPVYADKVNESDLYYAMNAFEISLQGDYSVEQAQDGGYIVTIDATFGFEDPYDWHVGLPAGGPAAGVAGFKDEWAAALHDAGLAEEFTVTGTWRGGVYRYVFPEIWLHSDDRVEPVAVRMSDR